MKVCKDIGRRCNFELYTYQHQYCKMPNLNGKLGRYHTDRYVGTSMKLCYALNSMKPLLITLACTVCTEKKILLALMCRRNVSFSKSKIPKIY